VDVHQNKDQYLNETGFGEEFKDKFQMETQLSNLDLRLRYIQTQLNEMGKKVNNTDDDKAKLLEAKVSEVAARLDQMFYKSQKIEDAFGVQSSQIHGVIEKIEDTFQI